METYFFISNEDSVYVFGLKSGNLRRTRGKRYKDREKVEEMNKRKIEEIGLTEITIE